MKIISGGTDNHLMLLDLRDEKVSGKEAEVLLDSVNITCNKNAIPNDPRQPDVTSGIRLGTPAVTTRGLKEADMDVVADAIVTMLREGESRSAEVKAKIKALTDKYPLI